MMIIKNSYESRVYRRVLTHGAPRRMRGRGVLSGARGMTSREEGELHVRNV